MLRGQIIAEVEETLLIDIFEYYGALKDVRMIKNRATGGNKDFMFI